MRGGLGRRSLPTHPSEVGHAVWSGPMVSYEYFHIPALKSICIIHIILFYLPLALYKQTVYIGHNGADTKSKHIIPFTLYSACGNESTAFPVFVFSISTKVLTRKH